MRGTNAWMPWTTPITLTPCTQRQSFTVVSHTVEDGAPTPALLHSTWHAPNRSNVRVGEAVDRRGIGHVGVDADDLTGRAELAARGVERRRLRRRR